MGGSVRRLMMTSGSKANEEQVKDAEDRLEAALDKMLEGAVDDWPDDFRASDEDELPTTVKDGADNGDALSDMRCWHTEQSLSYSSSCYVVVSNKRCYLM